MLSGRQIAAARTLVSLTQGELAARSNISIPTLKRMEGSQGAASGMANNVAAVKAALESAGVIFIDDERGEGVVKLRSGSIDTVNSEVIQYPEFLEGDGGPGSGG